MRKILAVTLSMLLLIGTGAAQLQDTGQPFDYNIVDREGDGISGNAQTIFSNPGNQNADKSSIEVCFKSDYRIREVVLDGSHGQDGVNYEFDMFLDSGSADSTFREGTKLGDNLVFDESQVPNPFNSKKYNVNNVDVSAGCHELEFVVETATTSSNGVVKIDTDDSAGSTKMINVHRGTGSFTNSFNEFGDVEFSGTKLSEPPSTTGLGSPDTFRFGEQPEISVEASDPDIGRTANNGTFSGETLRDGTINGASYTTDSQYGEALSFDGTDDRVDVDTQVLTDSSFSVCAWAKADGSFSKQRYVAASRSGSENWLLARSSSNNYVWKVHDGSFNTVSASSSTSSDFVHLCGVYDEANSDIELFKNSVSAGKTGIGNVDNIDFDTVGAFKTNAHWSGKVDNVRFYNRSLSASEVSDIFNDNKFIGQDLEGFWRFDKGSGSTAFDTHHRVSRFNELGEGGVSFDGRNDFFRRNTFDFVNKSGTYSFYACFTPTADNGRDTNIFQNTLGSSDRNGMNVFNGVVRFGFFNGNQWVSKSGTAPIGEQTCALGKNNQGTISLFVDGSEATGTAQPFVSGSTNFFRVGKNGLDPQGFEGTMTDVRVFNRVLSDQEAKKLTSSKQQVQRGVEASYQFENATAEYADSRGLNVLDYSVIPEVKLNVSQDGTQTTTNKFLEPVNWYDWNEQIKYKLEDAFEVTETGLVEATVQAFDEFGLTSSTSTTSQTVTDSNPVVTLSTVSGSNPVISPGGGAPGTFDRDRLYTVNTQNDGDDVPNEQLSCTLSSGYTTFDQRTITEGDDYSVAADLRVGDTTTTATCTEQKGDANTGSSQGVTDTVKAFRIQSLSFDEEVIENTTQGFTAQFKHAEFAEQATIDLKYDGSTEKTVTRQLSDSIDTGTVTGDVTTPLVQNANRSVPVEFSADVDFETRTGSTSTTTNSSSGSQRVFRKILTSCTTPVKGVTGPQAQKIVLKNETEQSVRVQGDIQYDYTIGVDGSPHTRRYSFNEVGTETATTCLYPEFAEYDVNGAISYSSPGFGNRLFELENATFTNSSSTLPLFLLPDTEATDTIVRVQDTSSTALDRTVKVLRFDVGTNKFVTAAKLQTGGDGVAEVGLEDGAFYEFVVQNSQGQVVATRDQERFRAQTVPARVTLTVGERLPRFVRNQDGFSFNVEQIKNNGNITGLEATVNHDTAALQNATLKVDKNAVVGQNTICRKTVQTSASTLFCDFNETAEGNQFTFVLSSFVQGDKYVLQTGSIDKTKGLFGINQAFAGFLVFMSLSAFGFVTPRLTVMFSTAGVIAAYTLGLISVGVGAMASLVAVALIVTFAGERTV